MKLTYHISILFAAMLAFVACKSDTAFEEFPVEEQSLQITVDGGFELNSRASGLGNAGGAVSSGYKLVSSENKHHIENAYVYIFNGSDDNAKCVFVADLDWSSAVGDGKQTELTYKLKEANLSKYDNADMQVLVMAVDNNKDVYEFPFDGCNDHLNGAKDKTVSEIKLQLAGLASGTDDAANVAEKAYRMANTEVFAGLSRFKADDRVVTVSLERCVAGVLCYLTDIPYHISGNEDANIISDIELQLHGDMKPNTAYGKCYDKTVFGTTPLETNVLASVNVSEYIYGKGVTDGHLDKQADKDMLLYVPAQDNGIVKTKENSILFGAYLLPIAAVAKTDESINASLKVVLKAKGEGVSPIERPVKNANTTPAYNYSLKANMMYSIGRKPVAGETDGDRPESLSGDIISMTVEEWKDVSHDVNFPTYALDTEIRVEWHDDYKFNCINTNIEEDSIFAEIKFTEDDANNLSNIKIQAMDINRQNLESSVIPAKWLQFKFIGKDWASEEWINGDEPTSIPDRYKGKSTAYIMLRLKDYVRRNPIMTLDDKTFEEKLELLKNDYRTAELRLTRGAELISSVSVNQYNAITAGDRGFSRLDVGDKYSMEDSEIIISQNVHRIWGFDGFGRASIFGSLIDDNDNGEYNSNEANKQNHKYYDGSPLQLARCPAFDDDFTNRVWFLPASEEIEAFFRDVVNPIISVPDILKDGYYEVINIRSDGLYWTSTTNGWHEIRETYAIKSGQKEVDGWRRNDNTGYMRQARHFKDNE